MLSNPTTAAGAGTPAAAPLDDASEAPDTITVPSSVLAGKKCKPGDHLAFIVVDVDPDSGDAEVKLAGGADDSGSSTADDMSSYPMETPDQG